MALTDDAIIKIKRLITSGQLKPGDKLPREKDLGAQLGLSRSSLREAVRALTLLGVLSTRRGDGTYVTTLEPDRLLETVGYVVDLLQDQTVVEVYEVRRLLEPAATALAAAKMDSTGLSRLRACMGRMEATVDVEELVEADVEFHDIIVGASGNATLASLVQSLASRTLRARIWRGTTEDGALDRTHAGHRAIYRAIAERNPALASTAAAMHVAEGELWIRRALESNSEDGQGKAHEALAID